MQPRNDGHHSIHGSANPSPARDQPEAFLKQALLCRATKLLGRMRPPGHRGRRVQAGNTELKEKSLEHKQQELIQLTAQLSRHPACVGSYIPTPPSIVKKGAVINIRTIDSNLCFAYCIVAGLTKLYQKVSRRQYENPRTYQRSMNLINWQCVMYPVSIDQIPTFMLNNPTISVNVFALCENPRCNPIVYPLFVTCELREHHFDLLLLSTENNIHYTLLKQGDRHCQQGLSRLMGKKTWHAGYYCFFCLRRFSSVDMHTKHMNNCSYMWRRFVKQ